MTYSILDEASNVAAERERGWAEYAALRGGRLMLVPVQRTDYPAPMSLTEIAAEYHKSHRTRLQRLPQWRWPW